MNKKHKVLEELLNQCEFRKNYIFDNNMVKSVAMRIGFGNPFDVTKIDNTGKLPQVMIDKDFFIVHLGKGKHRFIKGIKNGFHEFEKIPDDKIVRWQYSKSILNELDKSESNILSVVFNHGIIHNFLGLDHNLGSSKIYLPRRTKSNLEYFVSNNEITANSIQMEIDLTIECDRVVTIFECKNGFSKDFAVYQLFHPFLYYKNINETMNLGIKHVDCCYLLRKEVGLESIVRVYKYTFERQKEITSIKLLDSKQYTLHNE